MEDTINQKYVNWLVVTFYHESQSSSEDIHSVANHVFDYKFWTLTYVHPGPPA